MHPGRNSRAAFGVVLILLGIAFLLMNMGYIEHVHFWHFWPLVLILIGLGKLLQPESGRDRWSGLWLLLVGAWFQIVTLHLYGFTFRNSWPAVLIIWGLIHIGRALAGQSPTTLAKESSNGN